MPLPRFFLLLPATLTLTATGWLTGCTHPSRTAFAHDLHCPAREVRTRPQEDGSYLVSGCNQTRVYECRRGHCLAQETPEPPASEQPDPVQVSEVPDPQLVQRRDESGLPEALVFMATPATRLVFRRGAPTGPVQVTVKANRGRDTEHCAHVRFLPVPGDPIAAAARESATPDPMFELPLNAFQGVLEAEAVRLQVCSWTSQLRPQDVEALHHLATLDLDAIPTPASGADVSTRVDTPSPTSPLPDRLVSTSATEEQVRAELEAARDVVMACVGRAVAVVEARWEPDGVLRIGLRGGLSGSPEEGCVQEALAGLRVDAHSAGMVLHALR